MGAGRSILGKQSSIVRQMTAERFLEEGLQRLRSDSVLPFIEWLDTVYAKSYSDHERLLRESLVRLTVAVGETLIVEPGAAIEKTVATASHFLREPSPPNWRSFFNASTNSYPFGPGEGCYGVEELGHGTCGVGSGCRSGVGFLYFCSAERMRILEAARSAFRDWAAEVEAI